MAWFIRNGEGGIRYEWPTLVLAAVLAIVLLRWLVNQPNADSRQHEHRRVQTPEPGALGHLKA